MSDDDAALYALAGMHAAVECARIMDHARTGLLDPAAAQAGLEFIRADAIRGQLDIMGAQASVAVRAAVLACQASEAAGHPLTVQQFLDELQREFTPSDDPSGLGG